RAVKDALGSCLFALPHEAVDEFGRQLRPIHRIGLQRFSARGSLTHAIRPYELPEYWSSKAGLSLRERRSPLAEREVYVNSTMARAGGRSAAWGAHRPLRPIRGRRSHDSHDGNAGRRGGPALFRLGRRASCRLHISPSPPSIRRRGNMSRGEELSVRA